MRRKFGKNSSEGDADFDVNIAPVIDCFTVLICFMLVSATFLSIGVIDAGVALGKSKSKEKPPPINITIELKRNFNMTVSTDGKMKKKFRISAKNKDWHFERLDALLGRLKKRFPKVEAATIKADNAVEYNHIVRTMDKAAVHLPVLVLGGF